jgi:hypothetical protein
MISQIFDRGWGSQFPLKQLETQIVQQYLAQNPNNTVLINSTWYGTDYHQQVMQQLRNMSFDKIVLVSMLDAAIPATDWYQEFDCSVHAIGYYPGPDTIDFWAVAVDRYFTQPSFELNNHLLIDTAYMCLNRKPHWHRRQLYNQLVNLNIVDQGIVSMGGDNTPAVRVLSTDSGGCELAPNAGTDQNGIANDIMSLGHPANWQRHFLNVVTETQFDIKKTYFVSEKIYKPILGCRPFLVYSSDGAVDWLAERGFETYVNDFRDITDLDLSTPENIAPFLVSLSAQGLLYWQAKYLALKDKIMYNKTHFTEYVKQQKFIIEKGIQCQI